MNKQCVDDFEQRFPNPEEPEHILDIVRKHLGEEAAATAIGTANRRGREDAIEDDEEMDQLDEEEDEFVQEGLGGAGEGTGREIDEEAES